ncbi:ATP-binding protein [Pseudoalteromonas luteoviolacea]|uniref:histidine kinase n=1 Tax=Pseudoalteromonas luteoviolacea DSM 6061 TaxID=1365250 RepID=A0A166VWA6_9GAMM|nr:ATP-binding protein [Pseudoalteromonas luteoviolacea]KZN33944.1 hypothetical protein N475_19560 [Pseudoalteromonas luteoviolacea DSM 6061]MBE0385826.1 two-component system, autoinducer 2 sensor kinase/phosphatase LuxQ [Pseudoalteromonas luteoviolacea DSM 6061]
MRSEFGAEQSKLKLNFLLVILTGASLTLVSWFFYHQVEKQWNFYSTNIKKVYLLHDDLVQHLGYGGFIHDFKNLVLRKDANRYEPKLRKSLAEIHEILFQLESYEQYSDESITTIKSVINEYEINLETALSLIKNNASSEEIDSSVKVDDSQALRALAKFHVGSELRLNEERAIVDRNFLIANTIHFASVLVFIGVLILYFYKLNTSIRKEHQLTLKALEGSRVKSEFLANMSHEIRTPLNGVMGSLQVLQSNLTKPSNLDTAATALFSCRSLLKIINDILDFSKIEADEMSIEQIDFSLFKIVESVQHDFRSDIEDKSIYLKINIEASVTEGWEGDPVRLRQILLNLVSNAVKFTDTGGVTLNVSKTGVNDLQGLVFEVVDTGIGMSEQAQSRLFERFIQADNSITRKFGGTGLGLAITQKLIKLMNGVIEVKSMEGQGSTFYVFLPMEASSVKSFDMQPGQASNPNLSKISILVAEDDKINTKVIDAILSKTSAELFFASNGVEAVDLYRKKSPDLILMDIQMPEMGGVEACELIRLQDNEIPIVALTANVLKEDIEKYHKAGFTFHVGKPIDKNILYTTIVKCLHKQIEALNDQL